MSSNPKCLTIHHAQVHQPWTVLYSHGVTVAACEGVPHILATHDCLHAMKSLGKLAAVFEQLDHSEGGKVPPDKAMEMKLTIRAMAADLVTAALRLGNLYEFSVAEALVERVRDKNSKPIPEWPAASDARDLAGAAVTAMNAQGAHPVSECEARGCNCGGEAPAIARHVPKSSMTTLLPNEKQQADDRVRDQREGVRVELTDEQRAAMMEGCGAFDPRERPRGFPGHQSPADWLDKRTVDEGGPAEPDFGYIRRSFPEGTEFKQPAEQHGFIGVPPPDDDELVAGDEHTAYDEHPIQSGRTDRT